MLMPWCTSVESDAMIVDSWPPPSEAVETNTDANLPESAPDAQSWPVASQNVFHWAGKLP